MLDTSIVASLLAEKGGVCVCVGGDEVGEMGGLFIQSHLTSRQKGQIKRAEVYI